MLHNESKKLPKSLLQIGRAQRLFESVWKEIAAEVEDKPFVVNLDRLTKIPIEAQTIYWLWRFQSEAGSGGLEVFVLDALGAYAPQIHAALKMVGASELTRRLESAIAFARSGAADFRQLQDQSWFNQFSPAPEYPTLQSVDIDVFPIIRSLTNKVVEFIKSNENVLFENS